MATTPPSTEQLKEIHRLTWHMLDDSAHDVSANIVTIDLAISGEYYNALMEIIGDECPRTMTARAERPTPETDEERANAYSLEIRYLRRELSAFTSNPRVLTETQDELTNTKRQLVAERARADTAEHKRTMAEKEKNTWEVGYYTQRRQLEAAEERAAAMERALESVFELIDSHWLVRDTKDDSQDGWAMRQLEPLRKLTAARAALARVKPVGGGDG